MKTLMAGEIAFRLHPDYDGDVQSDFSPKDAYRTQVNRPNADYVVAHIAVGSELKRGDLIHGATDLPGDSILWPLKHAAILPLAEKPKPERTSRVRILPPAESDAPVTS